MRVISLPQITVDAYASHGVVLDVLPSISDAGRSSLHLARFTAGGTLGRHAAVQRQLFAVVSGAGVVSGQDDRTVSLTCGQAAIWEPAEMHESTATTDMLVMIIETDGTISG